MCEQTFFDQLRSSLLRLVMCFAQPALHLESRGRSLPCSKQTDAMHGALEWWCMLYHPQCSPLNEGTVREDSPRNSVSKCDARPGKHAAGLLPAEGRRPCDGLGPSTDLAWIGAQRLLLWHSAGALGGATTLGMACGQTMAGRSTALIYEHEVASTTIGMAWSSIARSHRKTRSTHQCAQDLLRKVQRWLPRAARVQTQHR